jgi:hypothetical protein
MCLFDYERCKNLKGVHQGQMLRTGEKVIMTLP